MPLWKLLWHRRGGAGARRAHECQYKAGTSPRPPPPAGLVLICRQPKDKRPCLSRGFSLANAQRRHQGLTHWGLSPRVQQSSGERRDSGRETLAWPGRACFPRNDWGSSREQAHQGGWKCKPSWVLIGTECRSRESALKRMMSSRVGGREKEPNLSPPSLLRWQQTSSLERGQCRFGICQLGKEGSERGGP